MSVLERHLAELQRTLQQWQKTAFPMEEFPLMMRFADESVELQRPKRFKARLDPHGRPMVFEREGFGMFVHDNLQPLSDMFVKDISGPVRIVLVDRCFLQEDLFVSSDFAAFARAAFDGFKQVRHAQVMRNDDMTGRALDGAMNRINDRPSHDPATEKRLKRIKCR